MHFDGTPHSPTFEDAQKNTEGYIVPAMAGYSTWAYFLHPEGNREPVRAGAVIAWVISPKPGLRFPEPITDMYGRQTRESMELGAIERPDGGFYTLEGRRFSSFDWFRKYVHEERKRVAAQQKTAA